MFQKEGSFHKRQGKKIQDTPLRKSDRRKLRTRFLNSLLFVTQQQQQQQQQQQHQQQQQQQQDTNNDSDTNNNNASIEPIQDESNLPPPPPINTTSSPITTAIEKWMDEVFLNSNSEILLRRIKKHGAKSNAGSTIVYLRSPSSSSADTNVADGDGGSCDWPYPITQPILIELPPASSSSFSGLSVLVPTVALLSILPFSLFDTTSEPSSRCQTVLVPTPVSKFLCRGADLMRSGMMTCPSDSSLLVGGTDNSNDESLWSMSSPSSSKDIRIGTQQRKQPSSSSRQTPQPQRWVAIKAHTNPQPFALGLLTPLTSPTTTGPGTKGIGVEIITCYGDDLWRMQLDELRTQRRGRRDGGGGEGGRSGVGGGLWDVGGYGNVGFLEGKVVEGLEGEESESESESEEESEREEGGVVEVEEDGTNNEMTMTTLSMADETTATTTTNEINETYHQSQDTDQIKPTAPPPPPSTPTPEETLHNAFYKSLLTIPTSAYSPTKPLPISTYYTQYLLPSRTPGSTISLKATRYGKLSVFLLDQAAQGLVTLKASADGKDLVAFLVGVDKNHLDLRDARRTRKEERLASAASGSAATTVTTAVGGGEVKSSIAIVNLVLIPPNLATLLHLPPEQVSAMHASSIERRGTNFLKMNECRAILEEYVRVEGLVDEFDPELVTLDGPLCEGLYRARLQAEAKKRLQQRQTLQQTQTASGSKQQQPTLPPSSQRQQRQVATAPVVQYPENVTRKELHQRWTEKMERGYAIVQMPEKKILSMKRGRPPMVQLEVEARKNGRKFVTMVRGLEEYDINAALFANDVSKRFACAASLDDNPTGRAALKKKGYVEISFGGHLSKELRALLTGITRGCDHGGTKDGGYGVPKDVIEILLRKGVK